MVVVVDVVVVVKEERAGGVEDVERGTSVDAKDISVDGTEGEVTVMVAEEMILSDEEENRVEAEGVELDSEGVTWAGFDSSHRPFLQQEDSRKSNRQETLSTTTTATGLKAHAHKKGHANSTDRKTVSKWLLLEVWPGMVMLVRRWLSQSSQRFWQKCLDD